MSANLCCVCVCWMSIKQSLNVHHQDLWDRRVQEGKFQHDCTPSFPRKHACMQAHTSINIAIAASHLHSQQDEAVPRVPVPVRGPDLTLLVSSLWPWRAASGDCALSELQPSSSKGLRQRALLAQMRVLSNSWLIFSRPASNHDWGIIVRAIRNCSQ